jgi:hypothetical protein
MYPIKKQGLVILFIIDKFNKTFFNCTWVGMLLETIKIG